MLKKLCRDNIRQLGGEVVLLLNDTEEIINFNQFLDCMGDGVSIQDKSYKIIYQNEAHKKITGNHVGEYCYRAYSFREQICQDCPVALSFLDGKMHTHERTTCPPDGVRHVEITASPLKNASGEIIAAIEMVRDIAPRKQIEEELKKSEERFRMFADFTYDWEYWIDPEGNPIYISPACEKITGYTPQEFKNDPDLLGFLVHPDDRDSFLEHLQEYLTESDRVCESEFRISDRKGEQHWIAHACRPVYGQDGQYMGRRASNRDITEGKIAEEELQKAQRLESIGFLAGGIAHDFNNILTAILGNIELAKMFLPPSEKAFSRLLTAEKAAVRARGITQQLLTFSQGGAPIKKVSSVRPLIHESVEFALRGSNVKSECSLADDLWLAEVDENQINQVINNLAINASQSMPEGGILKASARNETIGSNNPYDLKPGKYVRIELTDQGIGIPKNYQKKIFDPYFTTKENGSGLGLAISYSIMKRHDGTIIVDSSPGEGSTFSIFLPAAGKKETVPKTERNFLPFQGTGRILIMDDDETVAKIAADLLEHLGYRVETAKDGTEAVAAYENAIKTGDSFTAVITDLTIPGGMGGRETVRHLRELDPQAKVIVASGYANDPIMFDYAKCGFCGVIPKPYKLDELGKILRDVIGGK
jgi:PAS domain S-box-containing protein